jgi:hypothetical protein
VQRGAKFKRPSPVKAATTLWLQHANPLPAFIEAHCVPSGSTLPTATGPGVVAAIAATRGITTTAPCPVNRRGAC